MIVKKSIYLWIQFSNSVHDLNNFVFIDCFSISLRFTITGSMLSYCEADWFLNPQVTYSSESVTWPSCPRL